MGERQFAIQGCDRARTENKWSGFLCADHSDEPLRAKIVVSTKESVPFVFCPRPTTTKKSRPSPRPFIDLPK